MNTIEFKHIGMNAPNKAWHIEKHSHSFYEVIVIMSASEKVNIENQIIEASTSDVLFFKPGVAHEEWSEPKPPLETIFFSFSSTENFDEFPLKINDAKGRLRLLANWMYNERADRTQDSSSNLLNGFLVAFIFEIRRLLKNQESPFIENIREYITKAPAKNHSLESLAKFANLSKFHFLRKFTEIAGVSPISEVRRIRLHYAHSLLLTTTEPLKSIAIKSGLKNETTLCRLFQKYYKHTPGQLRE